MLAIMQQLQVQQLLVSEADLLDGVLRSLLDSSE
jgi:hypothetical protein